MKIERLDNNTPTDLIIDAINKLIDAHNAKENTVEFPREEEGVNNSAIVYPFDKEFNLRAKLAKKTLENLNYRQDSREEGSHT